MRNDPLNELKEMHQNQYVSYSDLTEFINKYHLSKPVGFRAKKQRERLNRKFIKREQKKKYEVEGNLLDPKQIAAVVACEDAELILAPAGSGKTASLLAKLNYLTDELEIPAEEILVIAFTNKVVAELKERVKQMKVEIRTFHSLGNKIVKAKMRGYQLVTEGETRKFFRKTVRRLRTTDAEYAKRHEDYLNKNEVDDEEGELEELMIAVLGLQKSERVELAEFKRRLEGIKNLPAREKALDFYRLYAPVAEEYAKYLKSKKLYDFADMLNLATDIVREMPEGGLKYQYVLVDEAQDLSTAKYLLLKALLDKCRKVKLFAVGDDWQSIYRFAGSNLRVLDDFEEIFGRTTYRGMIELTYRFGQPTAKVSNRFIQKNPHQSRKKVVPCVKRKTPIEVRLNTKKQVREVPQDYETMNEVLGELYREYGEGIFQKKIQVISRYNRDVYRLVQEDSGKYKNARLKNAAEAGMELEWRVDLSAEQGQWSSGRGSRRGGRKLKLAFCSMHKAKGITRDIIIVINANSGSHGIPAVRGNEVVAEVLLAKLDDYPHAEERRLWYVAMTRAKEKTIIVSDAYRVSPFVFEISPRLAGAGVRVCPKCRRGIMQERRRKDGKIYYACSNFTGGCRYTEK